MRWHIWALHAQEKQCWPDVEKRGDRDSQNDAGCREAKEMELWHVGVQANQGQELDQDRPIDFRLVLVHHH